MDNLIPLREIARNRKLLDNPFVMFPALEATQTAYRSVDGIRFTADAEFKGDNRRGGARIIAYVKQEEKKDTTNAKESGTTKGTSKKPDVKKSDQEKPVAAVADSTAKKEDKKDKDLLKLYVLDEKNDTLRYINQKLKPGWNSVGWDMRAKGVRFPSRYEPSKDADDPSGAYVLPGTYKLVGLYNDSKDSTNIDVRLDPRLNITSADLNARNEMISQLDVEAERAQLAFTALQDVRKDVKMIEALLINISDSTQTQLKDSTKVLMKKLNALEEEFMEPADTKGYTSVINLGTYLGSTSSYLNSSLGDPGQNARDILMQTRKEVDKIVANVNTFITEDWTTYKTFVQTIQWPKFKTIESLK